MGQVTMYALVAFLACLGIVQAVHYTSLTANEKGNGNEYVYKYSAVVAAGQDEPAPYASKFQIEGKLLHQTEPEGPWFFKFHDVKHTMYNGPNDGRTGQFKFLVDEMKDYERPFGFFPNTSMIVEAGESNWSRNMKKSFVSLVRIPYFPRSELEKSPKMLELEEVNNYGSCEVSYYIYRKEREENLFVARKTYDPRSCRHYHKQIFFNNFNLKCQVEPEEDLVTVSEKTYEFEYVTEMEIRVKKITSHEKSSYLPWSHRSFGIQYVETNQTVELEQVTKRKQSILVKNAVSLPDLETSNILFDSNHYDPKVNFAENAYIDHTPEEINALKKTAKTYIISIIDYLQENKGSVLVDVPEYREVFGTLHRSLQYLDEKSLEEVLVKFKGGSERGKLARKVFLQFLPHLGTYAAWNFVMSYLIKGTDKSLVDTNEIVDLLQDLPMFVLNPTLEFVKSVSERLDEMTGKIDASVANAAVLAYSILLNKAYKNAMLDNDKDLEHRIEMIEAFLEEELDKFNMKIKSEPRYQEKILYILAMGNIQYKGAKKYLRPIVNGEYNFTLTAETKKPEKYRVAAMWALATSITDRKEPIQYYWPIFSNRSLPQTLRLTAYEFLVARNPTLDINLLMNVHSFMETEFDDHIFNYHYTTLKSMSESTNPCQKSISEVTRRILRLTKKRKVMSRLLSLSETFDYYDSKYDHGRMVKMAVGISEDSGFPHIGFVDAYSSFARRPRYETGIFWNIDGMTLNSFHSLIENLHSQGGFEQSKLQIKEEKVLNLLRQTKGHKNLNHHMHFELWELNKGYVTNVQTYFQADVTDLIIRTMSKYMPKSIIDVGDRLNFDYLFVDFSNQYQMVALTDIGIPAKFYNEIPQMVYLRFRPNIHPFRKIVMMKLEFEGKFYHHSHYGMQFFNPFAKVTQVVRRKVVTHATLPFKVGVDFNLENYDLKITFPRNTTSRFSSSGYKIDSDDAVLIKDDEVQSSSTTNTYCPNCKSTEYIITEDTAKKINYEHVVQLNETGLEYSYKIHSCNDDRTVNNDIEDWLRIFNTVRNPSETELGQTLQLILDQALTNMLNVPFASSCKSTMKISPSSIYPVSKVETNWRLARNIDQRPGNESLFSTQFNNDINVTRLNEKSKENFELKVQLSIDTKAVEADESRYSWDVDAIFIYTEYYRRFKLNLRDKTSESKENYCLQAEKIYPIIEDTHSVDELYTTSVLGVFSGNDSDVCKITKYSSGIAVAIKGELLDEQKELLKKSIESGSSCFKNPVNLLDWDITKRYNWNCLYDAVKFSTMRKYGAVVSYNKLSDATIARLLILTNYLRMEYLPYIRYRSDNVWFANQSAYIVTSYDLDNNRLNLTAANPYYTEQLENIKYGQDDTEDKRNDMVFDNVLFKSQFLVDFYNGDNRPCVAHADEVVTDLNQTVKMNFKDWTLLSGDHELMEWAVFVKSEDSVKVALKLFLYDKVLTVYPEDDLKSVVKLHGGVLDLKNDRDSDDESTLKMVHQVLMVSLKSKVRVYYTPYNVVVMPHIMLDRNIDGVCGHMGSMSYIQDIPLIYS